MIYWSYMVLIDLLIPAVMFTVGIIFRKHPPRNINGIWGYRTRRSMKNADTWAFANRYVGKIWYNWGMVMLPLSVFPMLFVIGGDPHLIGRVTAITCLAQLIPVIGSNFLVEKLLKEKFDDQGNPREAGEEGTEV